MVRTVPVLLFSLALSAFGADKTPQLDSLVQRYQELKIFNGSVLVAENGQTVLRKGYGEANMEWHIPNAPDTRFRLGSVTKQFTAALVLQMVEKGEISLDAPVTRYLPKYPNSNGDRITIHQLLNHTSGIPGYTELPEWGKTVREPLRPDDMIRIFAKHELLFEPGTQYSYSNSGFYLLGVILEKVSGKSYGQLVREQIFEPLGMKQSGYDSPTEIQEKRAGAYEATLEGYVNAEYLDMGQPYAAGSLYSSVDDLLLWVQALHGNKLLTAESAKKMFTPGLGSYGYGIFIRKGSVTTIEHSGGINGFSTEVAYDVESKRVYILLNNTGGAPLTEIMNGLRTILNGEEPKLPKTPAGAVLYKTWRASGINATMDQLKQMQAGGVYDTNAGQLMDVAGELLDQGKTADALLLAKTAELAAPKSANAAALVGRIEAAAGHKTEALAAYAKAISLSETPRNFPKLTKAIADLADVAPKK